MEEQMTTIQMGEKALKDGCMKVIQEITGQEIHPEKDYMDLLIYIDLATTILNVCCSLYFIDLSNCNHKRAKIANLAFAKQQLEIANDLQNHYKFGKTICLEDITKHDIHKTDEKAINNIRRYADQLFDILQKALKIIIYVADDEECVSMLPHHNSFLDLVSEYTKYYRVFTEVEKENSNE